MDDAQMDLQIDDMYALYFLRFGRDSVATRKEVDAILDQLGSTDDTLAAMAALHGTSCKTDRPPPARKCTHLNDIIERTGRSK